MFIDKNAYFFHQQIGSKISEVSSRQVKSEKERLKQAKYIAETEKRLYVKVLYLILLTLMYSWLHLDLSSYLQY